MKWLGGSRSVFVIVTIMIAILSFGDHARADFTFGRPAILGLTANLAGGGGFTSVSADGLELYFASDEDLWVTTRTSVNDAWKQPKNLGPLVNSLAYEGSPSLSGDGLSLYFDSMRSDGHGPSDIWVTRRVTRMDAWGAAENLGAPVNTSGDEAFPAISSDGLELYFSDYDPIKPGGQGGRDLWVTRRSSVSDAWSPPVNAGPTVNSSSHDIMPTLSADGLVLLFASRRPGGNGNANRDIWLSRRTSTSDSWGIPVNLGPSINTSAFDQSGTLSADGSILYFTSLRPGGNGYWNIWQAPVIPVVDFTGDYRVDIQDLLILIEHWGQNEPAYDMGPMPWGDGIIDVADLEVLMSYWGQKVFDPHFLAHWKMDETEGDIAYDSAMDNDASVVGNATWHPEGGQIGGAVELEGNESYLETPHVLNPADGVFSALAWVKGGSPGQVLLSQAEGANWLTLDAQGNLKTSLKGGTRLPDLNSGVMLSDDTWHRVGFIWDGESRALYIDDVEVARDPHTAMEDAIGGLNIGAGSGLEDGTFFSGLIDDVQIYNRVVEP